jgi:hypothetical protein
MAVKMVEGYRQPGRCPEPPKSKKKIAGTLQVKRVVGGGLPTLGKRHR